MSVSISNHTKNIYLFTIISPGVGGYSLGGGYSWSTDQYGLAIDTILEYELVLPNGDTEIITNETNPDLFFALKASILLCHALIHVS